MLRLKKRLSFPKIMQKLPKYDVPFSAATAQTENK